MPDRPCPTCGGTGRVPDEPSLFDAARAVTEARQGPSHRHDPDTSRRAARSNAVRSGSQRHRVLAALYLASGPGLTDDELGERVGIYRHVAGTRRGELVGAGLVEATDYRRPTPTGNQAIVWRITDRGLAVINQLSKEAS